MRTHQMQSCVHSNGTLECALIEIEVREPDANEVLVKMEAAPINPSDLGLMFGSADLTTLREIDRNGQPAVLLNLLPTAMRAMSGRVGHWLAVGNEGSGRVVATGISEKAQSLLGKRVGVFGGGMYSEYRCLSYDLCIEFPERISSEQAASCFVNPMTALGFMETRVMEEHDGIVHTAAGSNLGQMLTRLCESDGVPLVNIVRSDDQVDLLKALGSHWVLNCNDSKFMENLVDAIEGANASLAFDAIGGGRLLNRILTGMEIAATVKSPEWSRYGSTQQKQAYVYGQLDLTPTVLTRGFGWVWSVSGWLLHPFLRRAGSDRVARMRNRVIQEIDTTFASHYSNRISLSESLFMSAIRSYSAKKTGQKTLLLL